jgi:hypothetical protein
MTDDRDQRIDALRGLAREGAQQKTLPSLDIAAQPAAPRRSRKALLIAVISALVVVAVAGGLIARAVFSTAPSKQQQTSVTRVFDPCAARLSGQLP